MPEYDTKRWLSQSEWDTASRRCDVEWALLRERFPELEDES